MTSPPISEAERARAIELCAKATSGPWQTRFFHRMFVRVRGSPGDLAFNIDGSNDWNDCDFIAFSRTAIPAYESRVVELEAAVADFKSKWEAAASAALRRQTAYEASEARATAADGRVRHAENSAALMLQERERFAREKIAAEEWRLTAEAELRRTDPNYTPLLDKYAADIQSYADRVDVTEARATALLEATLNFDVLAGIYEYHKMAPGDPDYVQNFISTIEPEDFRALRAARAAILKHQGGNNER